jgi:putative ABC transport system substrate-binding protein
MNQKIFVLALGAVLYALCSSVDAQQTGKIFRMGYLDPSNASGSAVVVDVFRQELRKLGWVEGKNISIEYRFAEQKAERLPELAADLVRLKVDLIVVPGAPALAAKNATTAIPIVMINTPDPVALGLVANLAHPGGNITGLSNLAPELSGKRLELLKEVIPKISHVALLAYRGVAMRTSIEEAQLAARSSHLKLELLEVTGPGEFESAFEMAKKRRAEALMQIQAGVLTPHQQRIIELAAKYRLPALYNNGVDVEAGGLISYGFDAVERQRRLAALVDKILKGAKPADLPVEQPAKFELVINLKTAKQTGLTIPPNVLARADRVIR